MRIALRWASASSVVLFGAFAGIGGLAGCQSTEYHGASPSARYFSEQPRESRDIYLGMNFKWSLDRPEAYHASPALGANALAATASPGASASAVSVPRE